MSKTTGVNFDITRDKWVVRITVKGKVHYLGTFWGEKDAIKARKAAEIKYNQKPGHTGVNYHKARDRWIARIKRGGKSHYLGSYITEAEAIAAREKAEQILDVMQPRESLQERRLLRERERILKEIDEEYEKRFV